MGEWSARSVRSVINGAADRLRHVGFLLLSADPRRLGPADLLVALRDRPTLAHFDPEVARYWRTGADRRGHASELTRNTPMPYRAGFSWGTITIADRYGITNEFVTLGGDVTAEYADAHTTVIVFHSPGPILRRGGHSQDVDPGAVELGAFFGRIMVPIDFQPGVEEAISAASPMDRYAAFITLEHARFAASAALREAPDGIASIFSQEAQRLAAQEPEAVSAGRRLLSQMELLPDAGGSSV